LRGAAPRITKKKRNASDRKRGGEGQVQREKRKGDPGSGKRQTSVGGVGGGGRGREKRPPGKKKREDKGTSWGARKELSKNVIKRNKGSLRNGEESKACSVRVSDFLP